MRNTFKAAVAVALSLAATSTQAAAQENQSTALACVSAVYNAAAATPIRSHLPFNPADATLAQLSDQSQATRAEIAALLAVHSQYSNNSSR